MKLLSILGFGFLALSAPFPSLIHAPVAAEARGYQVCGSSSYINSSGHCVHRPMLANPAASGATAKCHDGTYSFSEHHRGTCSWHGGVAVWLSR